MSDAQEERTRFFSYTTAQQTATGDTVSEHMTDPFFFLREGEGCLHLRHVRHVRHVPPDLLDALS